MNFVHTLIQMPRTAKRLVMVSADVTLLPLLLWVALALQSDRLDVPIWQILDLFAATAGCALVLFSILGPYRTIVRHTGPGAMAMLALGTVCSAAVLAAYDQYARGTSVPLSAIVIYAALGLLYVAASRLLVRYLYQFTARSKDALPVAIYSAGDLGADLLSALNRRGEFRVVAFFDERRSLQGNRLDGIEVHAPDRLPSLVEKLGVKRVLLAVPPAGWQRRREIVERLEPLGVHIQSVPGLSDIVSGKARIDELREIDVFDVLGRDPVPPDRALLMRCIRDKNVLVTGAGGSIGAELCRQILQAQPRRLVLLEISEIALYEIERELRGYAGVIQGKVELVPLLGSTCDLRRLREIMQTFEVQTVYHAAAYKHVPIVEHNVIDGIRNNVIGTRHVAEVACEARVETFVLISTDKAVNPTNVMGATKRLSELVLQGMQPRSSHTRLCMVRFGNVLASSGSVVPLFQDQIRRGGPVTVTHPDVNRFFMTIPEAAQLVIQAGAMAAGGEVFLLDMGQSIRIDHLARRMIGLMGLTVRDADNPDGDIEIQYTGLRAGEKLHEELLIGADAVPTQHPKIMRALEHGLSWEVLQPVLAKLERALNHGDCRRSLELLADAVVEYQRPVVRDRVWAQLTSAAAAEQDGDRTAAAGPSDWLPDALPSLN